MKTLMIVRHAKASRDLPVSDFERPLKGRGQRDADTLGRILAERNFLPGCVICSSAARALQTAERIIAQTGGDLPMEVTRELYLAPWSEHVRWLRAAPPEHERVMVVGHNPELEDWQANLTGRWERLTPGAMAVVRLPIDSWERASQEMRGELLEIYRPKDHSE
jgi:phosphohistidine phosphatase